MSLTKMILILVFNIFSYIGFKLYIEPKHSYLFFFHFYSAWVFFLVYCENFVIFLLKKQCNN